MTRKLFVNKLVNDTNENDLNELFSKVGGCTKVSLAKDKVSGDFKGFAVVEMKSEQDAKDAIDKLDGAELKGAKVSVSLHRTKQSSFSHKGKKEILPPIQRVHFVTKVKNNDPYLNDPNKEISYWDVKSLAKFVSNKGRILPRKTTGLNAYNQRKVAKAIKRAQSLGLMPYSS